MGKELEKIAWNYSHSIKQGYKNSYLVSYSHGLVKNLAQLCKFQQAYENYTKIYSHIPPKNRVKMTCTKLKI